eukprot:CAMPEP_0197076116 /NCGR_PEP_ID=MMETSP1384-20130603/211946_1 /TAXON_ID=29189 /ORGANISM="Ammonia sp." /LENGTH=885 /DNA_ID=CAMNT_0042514965 /DNA_START=54 /DNA_END=2711 /DNA_ORIENTATION=+
MSVRLNVGDAVLVATRKNHDEIGVIKYIGAIHSCDMTTEYVGIELVKPIENGHNGTIDGCQYFSSPNGHGYHSKLTCVVRKLCASELVKQLREIFTLFTKKLAEKDKRIRKLQAHCNCDAHLKISRPPPHERGSSKSLRLLSSDSDHLPRRESASASTCTFNAGGYTAVTSMTAIAEGDKEDCTFSGLVNHIKQQSSVLTLGVIRDDMSNKSDCSVTHKSGKQRSVDHERKSTAMRHEYTRASDALRARRTSSASDNTMSVSEQPHGDDQDHESQREYGSVSQCRSQSDDGYTSAATNDSVDTFSCSDHEEYSKRSNRTVVRCRKKAKHQKPTKTKYQKRDANTNYKKHKQAAKLSETRAPSRSPPGSQHESHLARSASRSPPAHDSKQSKHSTSSKRSGSIISKSSRQDSIIKAQQNMTKIRHNIIRPKTSTDVNAKLVNKSSRVSRSAGNLLAAHSHNKLISPSQQQQARGRTASVSNRINQFQPYPEPYHKHHHHELHGQHRLSDPVPSNAAQSDVDSNQLPSDLPQLQHRPRSSPVIWVSPTGSNATMHEVNGNQNVRLYEGTNQLSPDHANAMLLDPPSPTTLTLAQQSRMHSNQSSVAASRVFAEAHNDLYGQPLPPIPQSSHHETHDHSSSNLAATYYTKVSRQCQENTAQNNGNQQFVGYHSNHSSSTISVPSRIDVWTQNHHAGHQQQMTPSPYTPVTPQTPHSFLQRTPIVDGCNETVVSETATVQFERDMYLNQASANYHHHAYQNAQMQSFAEYMAKPVVSVKYKNASIPSMQTMSIGTDGISPHAAPPKYPLASMSRSSNSAQRTGRRTHKASVVSFNGGSSVSTISPHAMDLAHTVHASNTQYPVNHAHGFQIYYNQMHSNRTSASNAISQ